MTILRHVKVWRAWQWAAVAALTAGSVAPAMAAPKYTRDSDVNIKVEQTEATAPLVEKDEATKKAKDEPPQPTITADKFIAIQGKVQFIRDAQIEAFKLLVADTDDDNPEKPDLLFRLAELYAQKQRYWRFRGMEQYQKINAAKSRAQKAKLKKKQKRYFAESKEALIDSIKVYRDIATNPKFRNYKRIDVALFYYAYTLQQAKYQSEARKIYLQLIRQHPDSKYIPFAYLAFADYFFLEQNLTNALKFYNKVLEFPRSEIYEYALYKKGWVFLNLNRHKDALEVFFEVVKRTKGKKDKRTLNKAAKKDFVRAYAEVGKPKLAYKAFQRVDRGYAFEMLQILGDIYLAKGFAHEAIYTFRELMDIRPKHEKVCAWEFNVVRAMLTVGNRDQQAEEVSRLVKLFTTYRKRKILPRDRLSECHDHATATTSELAKMWHNEANKTLNPEILADADKLYKVYLGAFPKSDGYANMQYYHAELLWKRAEWEKNQRLATELWERAAVAFTDVVKANKVGPKLRKESAYAAVLGWKNALAVDPVPKELPPLPEPGAKPKIPEPRPIAERQQKMIDAFDIYIEYIKNPKDEELVMMKFLKAKVYWDHNHLEKANELFIDILKHHFEHETAHYSANLLLDDLNRLQQYEKMLKWVDILMAKKSWLEDKPELAGRLKVLKMQSLRKHAEKLEKNKEFVACGEAYLEIFNSDPDAEKMDEVLYNAGVCYEKGKSIGLAVRMFEILSKRYPKSNHTQKAIVRLGNNYAAIAYYDKAATKYEIYAKKYGGEDDAAASLNNAVFYRRGLGQDDKAIEDTFFFIKQYQRKEREKAASAMFSIAAIYEKNGQQDKVVSHLKRYLREWGRKGGRYRELWAHAKIGEILWQQSCPGEAVHGACIRVRRERATLRRNKRRRGSKLATQCGPESKLEVRVVERDRRKLRDAQRHFRAAVKLWRSGKVLKSIKGDEGKRRVAEAQTTYWYAAARFYLLGQDYEEYLALEFPKGLHFDPKKPRQKKKSMKRFNKWATDKAKKLASLRDRYREIVDITGAPPWQIAAAARIGQMFQTYAGALYTAEVPKYVRTGKFAEDKWFAYCDVLTSKAAPLEKNSIAAFGFCLERSTQLSWFNDWSQMCERELGQIRPQDFPTAHEIYSEPVRVAPILDVQGMFAELRLE